MPEPKKQTPQTPVDELIARFQLESERAIANVRDEFRRLHGELSTRVATLQDTTTNMTAAVEQQRKSLEDASHRTRQGVSECNEAMKVAAKAAREAADSAAVYEKLKDSQPDFAGQVRALERRLAEVVDKNNHLQEQVNRLAKELESFEVVAAQ